MRSPERIIFVPLGDKRHGDWEEAASKEAWRLNREIIEEEYLKGRIVSVQVESLRRHPKVNPFYYLKRGITSMGGYLVKIEKMKSPQGI